MRKLRNICCGCESCVVHCPRHCIRMQMDVSGDRYPYVDGSLCIHCHQCERVCPVEGSAAERRPLQILAGKNREPEIRKQSSSGGVFSSFGEAIIRRHGVVFGVITSNDAIARYASAKNLAELSEMRGSKYYPVSPVPIFPEVQSALKTGKPVLFVGVPCHIAALRRFLKEIPNHLYLVDLICHGMPSSYIADLYFHQIRKVDLNKNHEKIFFRDKRKGWKNYALSIVSPNAADQYFGTIKKDPFLRGFAQGLFLREDCFSCPFKGFRSGSDITMGDFWGVRRTRAAFEDPLGVSILTVNTQKGGQLLQMEPASKLETIVLTEAELQSSNPNVWQPAPRPASRDEFTTEKITASNFSTVVEKTLHVPMLRFLKKQIKSAISNMLFYLHIFHCIQYLKGGKTR